MKLETGTVAALVVAGTGVCGLILQWRSGAGRTRSYNRLGQLLDMRTKVPDVLPAIRDVIDIEIVRVADKIGPVTRPTTDAGTPLDEQHTHGPHTRRFAEDVFVTMLENFPLRLSYTTFLLVFGGASLFSSDPITALSGVASLSIGLAILADLTNRTIRHIRTYHRTVEGRPGLPAIPEDNDGVPANE